MVGAEPSRKEAGTRAEPLDMNNASIRHTSRNMIKMKWGFYCCSWCNHTSELILKRKGSPYWKKCTMPSCHYLGIKTMLFTPLSMMDNNFRAYEIGTYSQGIDWIRGVV